MRLESVAACAWNRWQACDGISGSLRVERVAALPWNQWQDSPGIGGSFGVEYALHHAGTPLTDQHQMRQGVVKSVAQHFAEFASRYPAERAVAYAGNGNLLANYGFVAWCNGALYRLADEPVFKRPYTSIVTWKNNWITVEDLWFAQEHGKVKVIRKADRTIEDITKEVEFSTSGQALVRVGETRPLLHGADEWYDTRHLATPLRVEIGGDSRKITLYIPNAQFQEGLLRKALCQPIHVWPDGQVNEETTIPLTLSRWLEMARQKPAALRKTAAFLREYGVLQPDETLEEPRVLLRVAETTERLLHNALAETDYALVDDGQPLRPGQVRFINGHLEIFCRHARYPHNIFVRWSNGSCGFVVFPGKSGIEGTTLPYAQEFLAKELKVEDAILLDNGGDSRLWYRGQYVVAPSEKREELRSILVVTGLKDTWCADSIVVF